MIGRFKVLGQPGKNPVRHEVFHLERHPRQGYIHAARVVAPLFVKPHAGCGAPVVLHVNGVGGQVGLSAVEVGHGATAFLKKARYQCQCSFVAHHTYPKIGAECFLGDVVFGGAKPARNDNDIGPVAGFVESLQNSPGLIANGCFTNHADADVG